MRTQTQDNGAASLRSRLRPGAVVVAAHVAVIYAVAVSLGVVRSPVEEPLPVETIAENAITTSPEPASPPSADLAVTRGTQPAYPPASRRMGEEGVVALAVRVDERGRPVEVRVQQSSGFPRLDPAAVEGLRQWRFKAAMRDGAATTAWTSVRVRFRLDA